MDYGFIRVAVGDAGATGCGLQIQHEQLIAMLRAAADDGVRLIGFPELCITAYTCGDLFRKERYRMRRSAPCWKSRRKAGG